MFIATAQRVNSKLLWWSPQFRAQKKQRGEEKGVVAGKPRSRERMSTGATTTIAAASRVDEKAGWGGKRRAEREFTVREGVSE